VRGVSKAGSETLDYIAGRHRPSPPLVAAVGGDAPYAPLRPGCSTLSFKLRAAAASRSS
jgi:hypothetical protein